MSLPSTGPIKLSDIQGEFSGANPISLSEYYRGGTLVPIDTPAGSAGLISTTGAISIGMFRGTSLMAPAGSLFFSSPGTFLFTVPTGYTTLNVTTVGGGGGGGGHQGANDPHQGGIGGSGGYQTCDISVSSGQVLSVVVGAGGIRATSDSHSSPNGSYNGGDGTSTYISDQTTGLVFSESVASGGYGGGRSGGGSGDKGTAEDWGTDGFPPTKMAGNGRSGFPNGFDYWNTYVNQSRDVGRSFMSCPTGYPLATISGFIFGRGGEGCSGDRSIPPEDGTNGLTIIRWGQSVPNTINHSPIRGIIFPTDLSIFDGNTYNLQSDFAFNFSFHVRCNAYGGRLGGQAFNGSITSGLLRIDTWSAQAFDSNNNSLSAFTTCVCVPNGTTDCIVYVNAAPPATTFYVDVTCWAREQPVANETAQLRARFRIVVSEVPSSGGQ